MDVQKIMYIEECKRFFYGMFSYGNWKKEERLRDSSEGEALALQAWGPGFIFRIHTTNVRCNAVCLYSQVGGTETGRPQEP